MKLSLSFFLVILFGLFPLQGCKEDHKQIPHSDQKEISFYTNELRVSGNQWDAGDQIGIFAFAQGEAFATHSPQVANLPYTTQSSGSVASFLADQQATALALPEKSAEAIDIYAYYPHTSSLQGGDLKLKAEGGNSFSDLLYSENAKAISAETHNGTAVLLQFRHMMARLELQLVNEHVQPIANAVAKLTKAPLEGSFSFATKAFSIEPNSKGELLFSRSSQSSYAAILIPAELKEENELQIACEGKSYSMPVPATIRSLEAGKSYKLTLQLKGATGELSIVGNAVIEDRETGDVVEGTLTPQDPILPPNPNIPSEENGFLGENITSGDPSLLELPRPTGGSHNYLVTHRVNGEVNYSLEFDTSLRTPRFVAFTFDRNNSQKNTGRSNAWGWDPLIPSRYATSNSDFSGYSRGHLVASNDRVASVVANKQTFYYSNMALQYQNHNGGIWQTLEALLQKWAREGGMASGNKVLYVAKGITCDKDKGNNFVMEYGSTGIPVARYFWMAVIYYDGTHHYGIAFLTEHDKPTTQKPLRNYAMSVDELEEFIGQDLFFNFPDEKENAFEAQMPTAYTHIWSGI